MRTLLQTFAIALKSILAQRRSRDFWEEDTLSDIKHNARTIELGVVQGLAINVLNWYNNVSIKYIATQHQHTCPGAFSRFFP